MSVVVQTPKGWFVDSRSLIDQGYSCCIRFKDNQKSRVKYHFKRQCFNISKSHYNETACAAVNGGHTDILKKTEKTSKDNKCLNDITRVCSKITGVQLKDLCSLWKEQVVQKADRILSHPDHVLGDEFVAMPSGRQFYVPIRSVILEGTKSLVESARTLGYLSEVTDFVKEPLPSQECSLAALCEMAKDLPLVEEQQECVQPLVAENGCTSHLDLFSRVTENKSDFATVATLMGEDYVIPPVTAFLLSDFTRVQPLVHYGRKFDLIVMDPPWENKSVKRSRRYSFLPSTQLKRLPIPLLASPSCLVVTWVTNRPSHLRFVRDELYPHWGVEVLAEWFWVKVTTSGQFVFPLDSHHKKPYEVLVLGRYRSSADNSTSSSETSEVPVEDQRLIVSIPSALHSQKPSLSEVLKPYIRDEAKCLELFARSLQPGWTSWGNEVFKFQHVSYFTVTPMEDGEDAPKEEAADKPSHTSSPSPHH